MKRISAADQSRRGLQEANGRERDGLGGGGVRPAGIGRTHTKGVRE